MSKRLGRVAKLHWRIRRATVPSFTFASDRLVYRRLTRGDVAFHRQAPTPACLAEVSPYGHDLRDPGTFWKCCNKSYTITIADKIIGHFSLGVADFSPGIWIAPGHRQRG